jgi:hypothetical protein
MVNLKVFLIKLVQNLNVLREREAKYGGNPPLELLNQIADHIKAITFTEQTIRGELTESAWRDAIQPLLIAIEARTSEAASEVNFGDIGGWIEPSTSVNRSINQIIINVVNLLNEAMKQPQQKLEPAAQAIIDLTLAQAKASDPKTVQRYLANPTAYETPLRDILTELLETDRGLAARLNALLTRYEQTAKKRLTSARTSYQATLKGSGAIAQGPGAQAVGARGVMVGGNVGGHIITGSGNTVVGRDYVSDDKVGGDQVGRDRITGVTSTDLAQMFREIYQRIETRPPDPNVDREEITETVQKVEQEVKKGEEANVSKLERWLKTLKDMAPDITDATVACLTNPTAGVAMAVKKIAEKTKAEAGKT